MPSKKKNSTLPITVHTMEAELKFHISEKNTGQDLFDMVCRTIGLREHWYFDLEAHDKDDHRFWLKRDKKVVDQIATDNSAEHRSQMHCSFLVKYYPEDISEELIQDITQHLFFLQIKQDVVSENLFCAPEASVLLASYAVQADLGDYDENSFVPGSLRVGSILPQTVIDQYQMTCEMWEERIKIWYADHKGLSKEDAEKEFLKIAQDLEMFGYSYFDIKNKRNTEVSLGVNSLGLHIFKPENKLIPVLGFAWSEISHIYHTEKKFKIKTFDKNHNDDLTFFSRDLRRNNLLFELCQGNHQLYKQRRIPDTLEVQQMKTQAKEQRIKRQQEKEKLSREQEIRTILQQEKEALVSRVHQLELELELTRENLKRSEETSELLNQKAELVEEENQLLREKTAEAEAEMGRAQISVIKTEEEKLLVEKRAKDAELLAARILEDSEQRAKEVDTLKQELERARDAELVAKKKLTSLLYPQFNSTSDNVVDYMCTDMSQLKLEVEQESKAFMEKSESIQNQLKNLKADMDILKVEEKQTVLDRLHDENLQRGDTKYQTLQKTSAGSTKSRVAFFEEL
ncbi:merlin-like isoform X1 [Watersipora subatra]|uniref:merlin-like isoform X1 n=1 Tax=Watersipora subatra TaxID=2589382 RepID=UPI00355AD317